MPTEPPDDAEAWTQEEWIAWLNETDAITEAAVSGEHPPMVRPRTAGSMLGRAMHGLHEALFGPQEDQVVIEVGSGDPGGPEGMTLYLDEEAPERSWVRIDPERREEPPGA